MPVGFAYLSEGKIHLKCGDLPLRTVESRFGRDVRERALQLQQRHAWKTQGSGAQFMSGGMLWGAQDRDAGRMRIAITGFSRGRQPGELLYALETDQVSGLFVLKDAGQFEQRLFHGSDCRIAGPCASSEQDLVVCSVLHPNGFANLATMRADGSELTEITEGDSSDLAPSWVPGAPHTLVFQSAGMGRDAHGLLTTRGPYQVQRLNLNAGEMTCLLEDPKFDFLAPRLDANGTLYAIRRPYEKLQRSFNPFRAVLDLVLLPLNVLHALFQWLNFFTVRYTGKPLTSAGGTRQREVDMKLMFILGNLVDAAKVSRETQTDDAPALVPQSWQLVRQQQGQALQTLAKGVLSYDLAGDGTLLYSNGSAIYSLDPAGHKERLHTGVHIEQVVASV
jgi:hypothetical protein